MSGAMGKRVAKLEGVRRPAGCGRCAGVNSGVVFNPGGPEAYGPYPDGTPGPLPPVCPECGRRMPKVYIVGDRARWNEMWPR